MAAPDRANVAITDRLVAELRLGVLGQAVVGPRKIAPALAPKHLVVGVEVEVSGRLPAIPGRVTGDTALLKDWLDVAVVFHVFDAALEAQAGLVFRIPA